MTGVTRLLALLGLTVAVLVGSSVPASATFTDTAGVSTEIKTQSLQAPGSVSANLACSGSAAHMTVTWQTSSTPGVVTYRVTLHFSNGVQQHTDLAAPATSWSGAVKPEYARYDWDVSVTALTDYGWYRQSSKQGPFTC